MTAPVFSVLPEEEQLQACRWVWSRRCAENDPRCKNNTREQLHPSMLIPRVQSHTPVAGAFLVTKQRKVSARPGHPAIFLVEAEVLDSKSLPLCGSILLEKSILKYFFPLFTSKLDYQIIFPAYYLNCSIYWHIKPSKAWPCFPLSTSFLPFSPTSCFTIISQLYGNTYRCHHLTPPWIFSCCSLLEYCLPQSSLGYFHFTSGLVRSFPTTFASRRVG